MWSKHGAPLDLWAFWGNHVSAPNYEDRYFDWNWAIAVGPQRSFDRGNLGRRFPRETGPCRGTRWTAVYPVGYAANLRCLLTV